MSLCSQGSLGYQKTEGKGEKTCPHLAGSNHLVRSLPWDIFQHLLHIYNDTTYSQE